MVFSPTEWTVDWIGCGSKCSQLWWIGLDSVSNLVDWVGLDFEKWTHGHLCLLVIKRLFFFYVWLINLWSNVFMSFICLLRNAHYRLRSLHESQKTFVDETQPLLICWRFKMRFIGVFIVQWRQMVLNPRCSMSEIHWKPYLPVHFGHYCLTKPRLATTKKRLSVMYLNLSHILEVRYLTVSHARNVYSVVFMSKTKQRNNTKRFGNER